MLRCVSYPFFEILYEFYPLKVILLLSIPIFGLGSGLSGAALSSRALIAGRAISALGATGIELGTVRSHIHILYIVFLLMAVISSIEWWNERAFGAKFCPYTYALCSQRQ